MARRSSGGQMSRGRRPPRGYASGFFTFALDQGNVNENPGRSLDPAYVRSVEGGFLEGSVISETLGNDLHQVKHVGTVDLKPITIETGLASSMELMKWIQQTWKHEASMRSGRIDHGSPIDGAIRSHIVQEFFDTLITEVTFPALASEATSESAYLRVAMQPGRLQLIDGDDRSMDNLDSGKQKLWPKAMFRLEINDQEVKAKKIESFSIKQHVKKLYTGRARIPELVPAGLEISNITVSCNETDGEYFQEWYKERLERGEGVGSDRAGAIIYADSNGNDIFELTLGNVGLFGLDIDKSVAGSEDTKRLKASLYVETIELSNIKEEAFD